MSIHLAKDFFFILAKPNKLQGDAMGRVDGREESRLARIIFDGRANCYSSTPRPRQDTNPEACSPIRISLKFDANRAGHTIGE